ncbi:MAG: DUF1800 domain-containing protein [Saccharospirillum sp.]|nr:DUF1800 domain-containing protein [Saccharospirillum sp.]
MNAVGNAYCRFVAAFAFALIALVGCSQPSSGGANNTQDFQPADPPQQVTGGLTFVTSADWTEGSVRRVLHLFAFGGHASDEQITTWAKMEPAKAIAEILVVSEFHPLLSPMESSAHVGNDGSLSGLSAYWSSDQPGNPMRNARSYYALAGQDSWRSPARVWYQASMTRGLNPVRQKIGLYLTNYHMAVNLSASGMLNHQVVRYYDDVMDALAEGASFDEVLTTAAASAAIAQQYNHRVARFENGVFRGNENFAREYFQLFFGILNSSANPADAVGDDRYHEEVTIPNMARLLTGIQLGGDSWDSPEKANVTYDRDTHHRSNLEILGHNISGETALEKLQHLGPLAIEHPQSLHNLPVMIIRWLADDEIMNKPAVQDRLRAQWAAMPEKDLMDFLRAYAISTDFHTADRVKYYSIFDRMMTVHNLLSTRNEDVFRLDYNADSDQWNYIYNHEWELWEQGFSVFVPYHDVFGGHTGLDAYTSTDYFRKTYNMVTRHTWRFTRAEVGPSGDLTWRKQWLDTLPDPKNGSYYTVKELSEWLWQRFIADDLSNFGPLERVYVYAFVASGRDPMLLWIDNGVISEDWDRVFSPAELKLGGSLYSPFQDLANQTIEPSMTAAAEASFANRLGQAVNFIVSTPFMYYQEGR